MFHQTIQQIQSGNIKTLARTISFIENECDGYFDLLQQLPLSSTKIIGITGPPGAGKSTITDALIGEIVSQNKKVAVLCIDPSSPFNFGALLGDRIRMSEWYNNPNVFIRSLATRGSLGGLHPKIIEITDVIKAANFDYIIIETVGVGQSEVEIAGLADVTVVAVVPEAGDEVQTMKAGLMEIADVFVVNKSDRPNADNFVRNLRLIIPPSNEKIIPVIKTIATAKQGIKELFRQILNHLRTTETPEKKYFLLAEKAYYLIRQYRMKNISKQKLKDEIHSNYGNNLYQIIQKYF